MTGMCMGLEDMSERLSTTVSDGPPSYAVLKRTDQFTLAVQKAPVVGRVSTNALGFHLSSNEKRDASYHMHLAVTTWHIQHDGSLKCG